jgi:hypothetical protein
MNLAFVIMSAIFQDAFIVAPWAFDAFLACFSSLSLTPTSLLLSIDALSMVFFYETLR